jgi:hypothetical protein
MLADSEGRMLERGAGRRARGLQEGSSPRGLGVSNPDVMIGLGADEGRFAPSVELVYDSVSAQTHEHN